MTLVQSEPKAIKIGIPGGDDYSAMQGPCDTGSHIPTKDEWEGVINAGISLGAWTGNGRYDLQNFTTYLKVPALGHIQGWSGNHDGEGSYAQYWACDSTISSGTVRGYTSEAFYYYSGGYYGGVRVTHMSEGNLCPIRAFKDTSITPTSSWTKLYGTSIESGGIFWSSTDGLISISSDGSTWYTMQDKNLGATTVWNYGDSFTDAKCGNYYQRGNNYGFKYSGGWTSSTTTVDASTYGPGNYYSSSTRIKTSESSNYNWDTSKNQNLRGGETGAVLSADTDIKAVFYGTTKVRPAGGGGWTPGANTLAYYPLTSTITINDMSGNNKTLTNQGGVFGTYNGVDCVYCGSSGIVRNDTVTTAYIGQTSTMSAWVSRATGSSTECWIGTGYNNGPYYNKYVSLSMLLQATRVRFGCGGGNAWHDLDYNTSTTANRWYHLVQTFANDGTRKCYVNGALVMTGNQIIEQNISWFSIGGSMWGASEQYFGNGYASEIIIENKTWTDAEILDYYNQTKANYGL